MKFASSNSRERERERNEIANKVTFFLCSCCISHKIRGCNRSVFLSLSSSESDRKNPRNSQTASDRQKRSAAFTPPTPIFLLGSFLGTYFLLVVVFSPETCTRHLPQPPRIHLSKRTRNWKQAEVDRRENDSAGEEGWGGGGGRGEIERRRTR